ncbi:MAG: hypothetical protein ABIH52_00870 [Candidatus Aenigmatarchaeota archaeon]|nr:hypothetical protein [Nanoarchaeota archaeon]
MIELERTFLIKKVPDLTKARSAYMIDIYIPKNQEHPILRIRKIGDKYEMTKKSPIGEDSSVQKEHTIILSEEEFASLSSVEGKKVEKKRYYINWNGKACEIDVFQGPLEGLVIVDFEFGTEDEKNKFVMPEFCLADVTQERFIAGGMLCGKKYEDIEAELNKFGYSKLIVIV